MIPCLTLTQPWATLVALGWKRYETRSWGTSYRGSLAIHAAQGWTAADRELCNTPPFGEALADYAIHNLLGNWGVDPDALPRGAVLCLVNLIDCRQISAVSPAIDVRNKTYLHPTALSDQERAFGNYEPGRWAWELGDVRSFQRPIPAKGTLGLWRWEPPEVPTP